MKFFKIGNDECLILVRIPASVFAFTSVSWLGKSLEDEYVTSQLENSYVSKFQIDDADSLTHSSLICRLSVVRKGSRIKFIFVNLGYPSHVSSL